MVMFLVMYILCLVWEILLVFSWALNQQKNLHEDSFTMNIKSMLMNQSEV